VLALWMARQSHGVLLSAQRWMERAGRAHVPCTWRGMRGLVDRVRRGRAAAVTADHFGAAGGRTTAASLLGRDVNVSTGVARIALAAGVPIVPVMTRYRRGKLRVVVCDPIPVHRSSVEAATRRMTSVFDAELRRDPSGWENVHRFLSSV
jgi:lauroyl/myristoyl acyltransferase